MTTRMRTQPADRPAYSLAEGARHIRLAAATLRSWVAGRPYPRIDGAARFHPLIHPPSTSPLLLSFSNLVEAHVLRSLRTEHGIPIRAVRDALRYAEDKLGIGRLLLISPELRTAAGQLFLDRYGQLVSLTSSGQIALRFHFEKHLRRVEWSSGNAPVRLYPFLTSDAPSDERRVAIDPAIAFGRPILVESGISTRAIAERIDAGETVEEVAADYGLERSDVEEAVVFEHAA